MHRPNRRAMFQPCLMRFRLATTSSTTFSLHISHGCGELLLFVRWTLSPACVCLTSQRELARQAPPLPAVERRSPQQTFQRACLPRAENATGVTTSLTLYGLTQLTCRLKT